LELGLKMVEEFFLLLVDADGTMRSIPEPFGVAVKTQEEAERFKKEGGVGYRHDYIKIRVFDNKDEAINTQPYFNG
jgi:hypothetical protein